MINLGQLIMTGVEGLALSDDEAEFIESENIGGVILFDRNFESPAQLAELVSSIQKLRRDYPLYIAVDHEGGRVIRFKQFFSQFPSMLELAKLGSPKICYQVFNVMAQELSACGVNLNFSPCCDVLSNPSNKVIGDRAFGTTAEEVSKYVSSAIRGLQTNGVMSCAKHFPGHGSTIKDSHFDLPFVPLTMEDMRLREIPPFVKAVKSKVEFVMMAHLQVDAIDQEFPTSLSEKAYTFLRKELKFKRVIITDDMQMGAITKKYGFEEAAVLAIGAGADMLEYRDMKNAKRAYEGLTKALQDRSLDKELVIDRINRVLDSKKRNLAEFTPVYIPEISKVIGQRKNEIFLEEINEKLDKLSQE